MFLVEPFSQNYDWGKKGSSSVVAQLLSSGYDKPISETQPYAELWMGDHMNGPCFIRDSDGTRLPITDFLVKHSLGGSLKFLFKVLSVGKSLSIQSHPHADLAKELHARLPSIYKDANPKPELAIALTPFKALFGFRAVEQVLRMLTEVPCLERILLSKANREFGDQRDGLLRELYTSLMKTSQETVETTIRELLEYPALGLSSESVEAISLARELNKQFPGGDVGVLSVFLLNIVSLEPGQCIFIGPNVAHAYLSGDLIECMTNSDNVIRGGLTPKFKDIETLLSSLHYVCTDSKQLLYPIASLGGCETWIPPEVPFAVSRFSLSGSKTMEFETTRQGPSIALVLSGSGEIGPLVVCKGQVILLLPNMKVSLRTSTELDVFVAFTP